MSKGLVLLSGGQDSTTVLYKAKQECDKVHAITINYNQRHRHELRAAEIIADKAGIASYEVIKVGPILVSTSPLVDAMADVGQYRDADSLPGGVEPTFIPARNILFLTIAANRAVATGVDTIYIGVSQEDYGGYYDCRETFINDMEAALSSGLGRNMDIIAPLLFKTKAQTVELAASLPGCMEALAFSHTCYKNEVPPCGHCHACLLRARGFAQAGYPDPLLARLASE